MMDGLIEDLCEITGFAGLSLQPNAGAQGEVQYWAPLTPPPRVLGDLTS
jgi:glycine cleavage system protein P-like pyridoxal-binding family